MEEKECERKINTPKISSGSLDMNTMTTSCITETREDCRKKNERKKQVNLLKDSSEIMYSSLL